MSQPLPPRARALLEAPNCVHLTTMKPDGSPRNWVVWVGVEGDLLLVCTSDTQPKAKDMLRDPRVALSVADEGNPYDMASMTGRVVEVRPDHDCGYMDPISIKYTGSPFPSRGPHRVCFAIEVDEAWARKLAFTPRPR